MRGLFYSAVIFYYCNPKSAANPEAHMIFSVVILAAPGVSQGADSALRFTRSLLAQGHTVYRLFFYGDGVHNATALAAPPQDEQDIPGAWHRLIQRHELDAVVCIAAAIRRGILDSTEAERYNKAAANLAAGFTLSGLGQLVDACVNSDRVVTFA